MFTDVQHLMWPQTCNFSSQAFNKVVEIWVMGYYLGESLGLV